jgi:hypothetical protein
MAAIPVGALPPAKGKWLRASDAAPLLRRALGSSRDWSSWLAEDRRERYADSCRVACLECDSHIFYDSADLLDLIRGIRSGLIDPKHGRGVRKNPKPRVHQVEVSGEPRVKIVTNGRALDHEELRRFIFELATELKLLPASGAVHA